MRKTVSTKTKKPLRKKFLRIKPSVYKYNNYRRLLEDFRKFVTPYNELKSKKIMSYKSFSKFLGFKTSSFILEIIQGKKNIGKYSRWAVVDKLGLSQDETMYFYMMALNNDSVIPGEKSWALKQMKKLKRGLK